MIKQFNYITELPNEILYIVISYLPHKERVSTIPFVSKDLYDAHLYKAKLHKITVKKAESFSKFDYLKYANTLNIYNSLSNLDSIETYLNISVLSLNNVITNNIVIPPNIIKLSIDSCEVDSISIDSMSRLKKILVVYTKFCKCNDITLPNTIESITVNCIINEDIDDESYGSVDHDSMSDSSDDESCSSVHNIRDDQIFSSVCDNGGVDDNYHDNGICNNDVNCNHDNICNNNSNINCSINDNKNHVTINTRNILQRYN